LEFGENPEMTFPIKKRVNTELFIGKTAALYIANGRIKDENVVRVVNHFYWLISGSSIPYAKSTKRCGKGKPVIIVKIL